MARADYPGDALLTRDRWKEFEFGVFGSGWIEWGGIAPFLRLRVTNCEQKVVSDAGRVLGKFHVRFHRPGRKFYLDDPCVYPFAGLVFRLRPLETIEVIAVGDTAQVTDYGTVGTWGLLGTPVPVRADLWAYPWVWSTFGGNMLSSVDVVPRLYDAPSAGFPRGPEGWVILDGSWGTWPVPDLPKPAITAFGAPRYQLIKWGSAAATSPGARQLTDLAEWNW